MHTTIATRVASRIGPSRRRATAPWPRRLLRWAAWGAGGLGAVSLLLAASGLLYQAIATEQDRTAYPPPGQLVDVGGHRLHINCAGTGSPTVVTESGFGGSSLDWSLVQPQVAQTTRTCVYDRAGAGWSEAGPSPRTSGRIVDELHQLLISADIAAPYILVGHSIGGLHAQLFASRHPSEVAGLVLLDPTPATYLASLEPAAQRDAAPSIVQLRAIQFMQFIGLTRLFGIRAPMPLANLSPDAQRQVKALGFKPAVGTALFEEGAAYEVDLAEALSAPPLRSDIPLVVLVRSLVMGPPDQDAAGKAANADLAHSSSRGQFLVAEHSEHFIQLDRPDLVIDAIDGLVQSVRAGR